MKQVIASLFVIAALAALVGCADNRAVRFRYEAEKKLFEAERTLSAAQVDPRTVSPELLEQARLGFAGAARFAIAALDSVDRAANPIEFRELQTLAFQATANLNHLLYTQRRFDESIDVLTELLKNSDLAPDELMVARVNLGRSLQASGRWDSAVTVYTTAAESYYPPLNSKGELIEPLFNLPALIFNVVTQVGDTANAHYEFQRAVTYYTELAEKNPGSQLEASSRAVLARLYEVTGQWQNEIAQLNQLSDTSSQAFALVRSRVAEIYGLRLRDYPRALAMYDSLLTAVGPADTVVYPTLLLKKALIRMEQKNFDDARAILTDLKQDYRSFYGQTPPAQLAMARSFELDNKWDRAEVEYSALIEGYRGSDEAMGALLYVARRYEKAGRTDQAERWYRDAGEYYNSVRQLGAGGLLEAKAMGYLAELAARQGDWRSAATTLYGIYQKFSTNEVGRQAILRAAEIHRTNLGEPTVADSLMAEFRAGLTEIETTPQL